jgi:hypothetical protein
MQVEERKYLPPPVMKELQNMTYNPVENKSEREREKIPLGCRIYYARILLE